MGMTTKEAAEYLGVTSRFVSQLCVEKVLNSKKHGRDWDIDPGSVEAYKKAPKNKGGRPPNKSRRE